MEEKLKVGDVVYMHSFDELINILSKEYVDELVAGSLQRETFYGLSRKFFNYHNRNNTVLTITSLGYRSCRVDGIGYDIPIISLYHRNPCVVDLI